LNRKLGGPLRADPDMAAKQKIPSLPGTKSSCPAYSIVHILTELPWLGSPLVCNLTTFLVICFLSVLNLQSDHNLFTTVVLLNKHNLKTQNGVATAENHVCVVVLIAEICDHSARILLSVI